MPCFRFYYIHVASRCLMLLNATAQFDSPLYKRLNWWSRFYMQYFLCPRRLPSHAKTFINEFNLPYNSGIMCINNNRQFSPCIYFKFTPQVRPLGFAFGSTSQSHEFRRRVRERQYMWTEQTRPSWWRARSSYICWGVARERENIQTFVRNSFDNSFVSSITD